MSEPSMSGSAPVGGASSAPQPHGSQQRAFQPKQHMGAPHLQSDAPAGPPPAAPVGGMSGPHLAPNYGQVPPAGPQDDPFARTIDLPSKGVHYPDGTKQATIRPMRGEEELNLAGTGPEGPDRSRAMREMVARCVTLRGSVPLEEVTILDYAAITLHLMAMTAGTDELNVDASAGCSKEGCPLAQQPITLTSLPCTYLRRSDEQEQDPDDVDPILAAAARTEAKLAAKNAPEEAWGFGRQFRNVADDYKEPFKAVLSYGAQQITVEWRHLRVKDQIAAEEFILETGASLDTKTIKGTLASYLSARAIVSINGQPSSPVMALQWWRKAPGPLLRELKRQQNEHSYGYDFRPQFRCSRGQCRKEVAVSLPKDGSLFRPGRS